MQSEYARTMTATTRPYGADLTHTLPSARVPEELRTCADARAEQDGTSLSELVRTAVDRYCNPEPADATRPVLFGRDPYEVLREAYNAGARKGVDFPTWLSTYLNRIGAVDDTPSL